MKDLTTIMGANGKITATVMEAEDKSYYMVNYGSQDYPSSFNKVFMTEEEATKFASDYIDRGNKPTFLSEA